MAIDDGRGPDDLFEPNRRLRRRSAVGNACERCGSRARWKVRGKRKPFTELGAVAPAAAPFGEWHLLCSACLEPVKAELELAELLELQVEPVDPHDRGRSRIVLPGLG